MILLLKTKIAGVNSGPTCVHRQNALKFIAKLLKSPFLTDGGITLDLEEEPNNPHDPDALKVLFEYEKGKWFHLGYIPNANTLCGACHETFERHPNSGNCPNCGAKGRFERFGTATRLKDMLDDIWVDRDVTKAGWVEAQVEEVTGGNDGQSFGCNISVWTEDP